MAEGKKPPKPFHEAIISALERCANPVEAACLLKIINETKIPKSHTEIIAAIKGYIVPIAGSELGCTIEEAIESICEQYEQEETAEAETVKKKNAEKMETAKTVLISELLTINENIVKFLSQSFKHLDKKPGEQPENTMARNARDTIEKLKLAVGILGDVKTALTKYQLY